MSGLSWFAVLKISSLPPARASHAQPLPNRVVAALASCSLNFAKSPNVFLMASASVPVGSPPPLPGGAMIVQNSEKTFGDFAKRSEEHTSELQSRFDLVCRLLLE